MESYQEVPPLWSLSDPQYTHLSDHDFLSLFQKQIPPVSANGVVSGVQTSPDAVNPQNLSMYSLSPPFTSDDSSPSPSNSNQDTPQDGANDDPTLKRKANNDRLENEPSSKTQHISKRCVSLNLRALVTFIWVASLGDKRTTTNTTASRRKVAGQAVCNFIKKTLI